MQRTDGNSGRGLLEAPPPEANVLIVDRGHALVELLGQQLESRGFLAVGLTEADEATRSAKRRSQDPPDIAIIGLSLQSRPVNGLDVMVAFNRFCPETALIAYVDDRDAESRQLLVAWDTMRPAAVISKSSPLVVLIDAIDRVMSTGRAEVDPRLGALIPRKRTRWGMAEGYHRLVPHAGHAKLWQALLDHGDTPTYKELAAASSLSPNTIRTYREDLLAELGLHGLASPSMAEMYEFAHAVRPLLAPVVTARLTTNDAGREAETESGTP